MKRGWLMASIAGFGTIGLLLFASVTVCLTSGCSTLANAWMPADGSPSTLTRNATLCPSALGTAETREIAGAAASAGMLPW